MFKKGKKIIKLYKNYLFKICSLLRHINAINNLSKRGMHFWDYGNAFLVECHRAGAKILKEDAKDDKSFIFPSYMQDIMGLFILFFFIMGL